MVRDLPGTDKYEDVLLDIPLAMSCLQDEMLSLVSVITARAVERLTGAASLDHLDITLVVVHEEAG